MQHTTNRKLERIEQDEMIAGVCAGIADYFNLDVTIVRLAFVLLGFASAGTAILLYFVLTLVMPERDDM